MNFGGSDSHRGRLAGAASNRVKRGGNFNNTATNLRSANRNNNTPTNHNNNIGIRCSKTSYGFWYPLQGLPEPPRWVEHSAHQVGVQSTRSTLAPAPSPASTPCTTLSANALTATTLGSACGAKKFASRLVASATSVWPTPPRTGWAIASLRALSCNTWSEILAQCRFLQRPVVFENRRTFTST